MIKISVRTSDPSPSMLKYDWQSLSVEIYGIGTRGEHSDNKYR